VAVAQLLPGDPPSPYEQQYGFSRIAQVGNLVLIGGMTSVGPGGSVLGETPYEQTIEILGKLRHELGRVDLGPEHVVATRIYVTDISRADEVGRAHGEFFGAHRPLMTMIQIAALIDPRMLVEIELIAHSG
jgi:enamine deaminase RidA (YjgF/YER057c/UK114 family)